MALLLRVKICQGYSKDDWIQVDDQDGKNWVEVHSKDIFIEYLEIILLMFTKPIYSLFPHVTLVIGCTCLPARSPGAQRAPKSPEEMGAWERSILPSPIHSFDYGAVPHSADFHHWFSATGNITWPSVCTLCLSSSSVTTKLFTCWCCFEIKPLSITEVVIFPYKQLPAHHGPLTTGLPNV